MAKKEKSTENNKNKKSFFKGFKAELKKVSWPTPKQLANNTVAVIAIVLLTTIIVFALDIVFEAVNNQGVEKLKQVISSSSNTTNETENNTTDDGAATETTEGTSENTTGAPSIPCANAETAQKNKTKNITIKFFIIHLLRTDLLYRPSLYKRKVLHRLQPHAESYIFLPEFQVLPSD